MKIFDRPWAPVKPFGRMPKGSAKPFRLYTFDRKGTKMPEKEKIAPSRGPKAVGPYSPAILADGLIFVSGQVAINPDSQEIERGTIQEQVDRIMQNLSLILEAAGSSLDRVVKASVFLADMDDFEAMNQTYGKYFRDPAPARTTIEVSRLPKDVDVEIDVIALAD